MVLVNCLEFVFAGVSLLVLMVLGTQLVFAVGAELQAEACGWCSVWYGYKTNLRLRAFCCIARIKAGFAKIL